MKVLVTGATGFVGSHLCRYFARHNVEVRQAVRTVDAVQEGVVGVGDIDSETDWSAAFPHIDVVVHLAARVHVIQETADDPLAEFRRVNTAGTVNLARQADAAGVKRLVFLSTIKVNGEETGDRPYRAEDQPAPVDAYGVSKMEAEQGLLQVAEASGMEVVIIRPPLIYGPGAGGNFSRLQQLVRKGWCLPFGSIRNKRSLIGSGNLCSLIDVCLTHPAAANRVLLASDNNDVSTPDLVRMIARGMGVPSRIFPFPVAVLAALAKMVRKEGELRRLTGNLQIDCTQTCDLLQWRPPVALEEGIRESVVNG